MEGEKPSLARELDKHFQELRFWGLIRKCEGNRYVVTPFGRSIITGADKIPEYVWTLNGESVAVPEGEKPAPRRHLWEMEPRDFSDKREHVDNAVQLSIPVSV